MIEKEIIVKELIPSLGADYGLEDFEYADVKYKFMVIDVDNEIVAISQVKILETPDEEEKEYQEVATLHMHKDAFKVFLDLLKEKESNG